MKWPSDVAFVRRGLPAIAVVLLSSVAFTSCATKGVELKKTGEKYFAVSSPKASFYRYGPQQGNGPDETLPHDTLMTLIRPSFGYCKVQLVGTSKQGYVASEDIKPAPPTLVAALTAPPPSPARENLSFRLTEPPPPETLPDPDLPPPTSEPSPQ
ncbi:MAG: hypothetical protein M3119_04415 [Verrucomicrobiota bacterium]|nr:hypothetical protein [Verrucomicrobiota bacterium]MDQ6939383.1 hypothetical protein [Verrucomicrobiota bacterium]